MAGKRTPKNPVTALLAVAFLDDIDSQGRTPVNFNIRDMNPNPDFKGVSVKQSASGNHITLKHLLEEARRHSTASLEVGYEETLTSGTQSYLYDVTKWSNVKELREGQESYGKMWQMVAKEL